MGPGQQPEKEAEDLPFASQVFRRRRAATFPRDLVRTGVPLIAVSGECKFIDFFRLDTREKVFSDEMGTWGRDLVLSTLRDIPVLAVGGHRQIDFVDLKTREKLDDAIIKGHSSYIAELVPLPSDSFGDDLISSASWDKTVRVWKKEEKKEIVNFEGHEGAVSGLCCIPFKKWLVSGSKDNTVRVWDLQTQKREIIVDHPHDVHVTQYHEEHHSIFSGSWGKTINMISLDGFRCIKTFRGSSSCWSLLLHPTNENLFLSGHYRGSVMLWDIRKEEKCVTSRSVHNSRVNRIVHLGGNCFASCSDDPTVKISVDHDLKEVSGAEEGTQMQTENYNWGLCCLVPFSRISPCPQAERIAESQRRSAEEEEFVQLQVAAREAGMRELFELQVTLLKRRKEASTSRLALEKVLVDKQVKKSSAEQEAFSLDEGRRDAEGMTRRRRLSVRRHEAEKQLVQDETFRRNEEEQERRLRWFLRMIHMEKSAPLLIDGGVFYDDLSRFLRHEYQVALRSTLSAFATAKLLLNIPRRIELLHLCRSDDVQASEEQEREEGLRSFLSKHRLGRYAAGMLAEGVGFEDLHLLVRPSFEEAFKGFLPALAQRKLVDAIQEEVLARATLLEDTGIFAFTTLEPSAPPASRGARDDGVSPAWMLHASNLRIFRDKPLGEGSFGMVYEGELAVGLRMRQLVAVKRISLRRVDQKAVEREVEFLASLDHEFVLRADGCYFDEDNAYLVTELCEKGSLPIYLESEKPDLPLRLTVLKSVALASMSWFLSCESISMKANVLMTAENVVKICDFGISKHEGSSTSGGVHGTPRFIPKPSPPRTARECDVYAFGILAYEVLSDKKVFQSLLEDYEGERRLAAIRERGVLPNLDIELSPSVPAVKRAIQSCWSDDPSDWPTFHDLVLVFEGLEGEEEEEKGEIG